jgi:hypothetical protein
MDETKTIPPKTFAATVVALMKLHQSSLDMISALISLLREKEVVDADDWRAALAKAKESEDSKRTWKNLEEMDSRLETRSLLDMLRDFSGPIQ